METKFVELNGSRFAYKEQGQGQTVVLLHGFCGSSAYWDELMPLLPDDYRFITPDLRGHGESGAPETEYSMEAFADDLAALIKQLGSEQAIVVGHSLGGYATLAFAERYPELLTAFGLVHSTAFPDSDASKEARIKAIESIWAKGLEPYVRDGLVPKLFSPAHLHTMPEAVRKAVTIGLKTAPDAAVRTLDGMRQRPDRNHVLAEAKVPVLIAAGIDDQIIPVERAFSVSGGHITQSLLEHAGHMSMIEAPEQLAKIIIDFIAAVKY